MNNDRELLELAAKAYFDDAVVEKYVESENYLVVNDITSGTRFAPLTDDGDALRLAVKLNLSIRYDCCDEGIEVRVEGEWDNAPSPVFETFESEGDIATRRAIVRAAAEIGRTM